MTAQLLDGTATAAAIKGELRDRVAALAERGIVPGLGTLLVGDDGASRSYVTGKHRDCAEVGVASITVELPATATQDEIADAVRALNADPAVTGFIVQLPLPKGINAATPSPVPGPMTSAGASASAAPAQIRRRPASPTRVMPSAIAAKSLISSSSSRSRAPQKSRRVSRQ